MSSAGICPYCLKNFKKLKTHFNSCFIKNNSKNTSASSDLTTNGTDNSCISSTLEIIYSPSRFDFNKQRWKCQFCDNYYKDLKSKYYANHIKKEHKDKLLNDFYHLIDELIYTRYCFKRQKRISKLSKTDIKFVLKKKKTIHGQP